MLDGANPASASDKCIRSMSPSPFLAASSGALLRASPYSTAVPAYLQRSARDPGPVAAAVCSLDGGNSAFSRSAAVTQSGGGVGTRYIGWFFKFYPNVIQTARIARNCSERTCALHPWSQFLPSGASPIWQRDPRNRHVYRVAMDTGSRANSNSPPTRSRNSWPSPSCPVISSGTGRSMRVLRRPSAGKSKGCVCGRNNAHASPRKRRNKIK